MEFIKGLSEMTTTNFFFAPLCAAILIDWASGLAAAAHGCEIKSKVGMKGIPKKVGILCVVILAGIIQFIVPEEIPIGTITTLFYLVNEAISILENCASIGLKIPESLTKMLAQLQEKEGKQDDTKTDLSSESDSNYSGLSK